jgi:hypothetical protein
MGCVLTLIILIVIAGALYYKREEVKTLFTSKNTKD